MNQASITITVHNPYGLHVRPAERISNLVRRSGSEVFAIDRLGKRYDAGDCNALLTIGAKRGDVLRFAAVGRDADQVLDAIQVAL